MTLLPRHVDYQQHVLSRQFSNGQLHAVQTFDFSHLNGTLKLLPKIEMVRKINVLKQ